MWRAKWRDDRSIASSECLPLRVGGVCRKDLVSFTPRLFYALFFFSLLWVYCFYVLEAGKNHNNAYDWEYRSKGNARNCKYKLQVLHYVFELLFGWPFIFLWSIVLWFLIAGTVMIINQSIQRMYNSSKCRRIFICSLLFQILYFHNMRCITFSLHHCFQQFVSGPRRRLKNP